ncbi:MAG: hypothetical protein V3U49_01350 [Nitrososphaerales archaeon]
MQQLGLSEFFICYPIEIVLKLEEFEALHAIVLEAMKILENHEYENEKMEGGNPPTQLLHPSSLPRDKEMKSNTHSEN